MKSTWFTYTKQYVNKLSACGFHPTLEKKIIYG